MAATQLQPSYILVVVDWRPHAAELKAIDQFISFCTQHWCTRPAILLSFSTIFLLPRRNQRRHIHTVACKRLPPQAWCSKIFAIQLTSYGAFAATWNWQGFSLPASWVGCLSSASNLDRETISRDRRLAESGWISTTPWSSVAKNGKTESDIRGAEWNSPHKIYHLPVPEGLNWIICSDLTFALAIFLIIRNQIVIYKRMFRSWIASAAIYHSKNGTFHEECAFGVWVASTWRR